MKQDEINNVEQREATGVTEEKQDLQAADSEQESSAGEPDALQKGYDELNDRYLRLMAEYDNFRKRTQREKEDIYANCTVSVVEKFLPVWDNFERAAAFDPGSEDFVKGFELMRTGFSEVLAGLKVEAFGEPGDAFDPARHNAISHIEDEAFGENVVSVVMQRGYRIGDKILRYAMVQTAN